MSHFEKLAQTIKLSEWRPDRKIKLPEFIEDLPKIIRDIVIADEKSYQELATRVNWLLGSPHLKGLTVGGDDDYTEIESDGTLEFNGGATVWDDIQNSLIGKRLSSVAGKVDYNWTENSVTFQSGGDMSVANDRLIWNQQFPHAAKKASSLYPHIHFEQVNSNKLEFRLDYRIQSNNAAKTTSWTEINANTDDDAVYTYTSGTLNQILSFPAISMSGKSISSTVQFRMVREDATAGDIEVTFVDCHVEYDMGGSRSQFVK